MITPRSLVSRSRRFPELRRTCYRLRSLKRGRYARNIFAKKIGDNLALVLMCNHVVEFLECSFSQYSIGSSAVRSAKERMVRALNTFACECARCASSNSTVPSAAIRRFGSSVTKFHKVTRRVNITWDCDEMWHQLGLCAQIAF